jgi:hypothetical protein
VAAADGEQVVRARRDDNDEDRGEIGQDDFRREHGDEGRGRAKLPVRANRGVSLRPGLPESRARWRDDAQGGFEDLAILFGRQTRNEPLRCLQVSAVLFVLA